jgi:hypothetical protein
MIRLVPVCERSRVVSDALRKELLRRRRELTAEMLKAIRLRTGNLGDREIVETLGKDRALRG